MAVANSSDSGWPGGWVISAVAGVVAAILARWLGDIGMSAAVLVGLVVFLCFGVLLGMFWTAPAMAGGHGHDSHGHDLHGSDSHSHGGHAQAVSAPSAAPAMPAQTMPRVADTPAPLPVAAVPETASQAEATPPPVDPAPLEETVATASPDAASEGISAAKPAGLSGPRGGVGDDLQTLEGIGPVLEKLCHEMGIFHFDQIAAWGDAETAWMDGNLKGFKGRVSRDKWVRQARLIGEVGLEEFKRRAKTNDY